MKTVTASWTIRLTVDCPHCGEYLDLLDWEDFPSLNDDGGPMRLFEGGRSYNEHDHEIKYYDAIECPKCKKEFKLDGIEY